MQSTDSSYSVPPFPAFPSTSRYVPLGSVQEAMGRVCRSIDAREAVSLVIGPPGTGKSLICGLLAEHYRSSHEVVVIGQSPLENRSAFERHLLHRLGVDLTAVPDKDLQLALIDRVCNSEAPEGGLLIVVDEAQSLSTEVIEAIRMTTNIMRDGQPRVFAVLCGGVKLDELLVDTCMEAFTQRVATRCYLHPMNGEETRRYISETIRNCGANPDQTICDEAIAAVHHACSGVPRLVNQILTQAIDCAEEASQSQITEHIIDQAWAQLQQLPSPMVEEPKITRGEAEIEFGELDDSVSFGQLHSDQGSLIDDGSSDCEDDRCDGDQCEEVVGQSTPQQTDPADAEDRDAQPEIDGAIVVEQTTAQWIEESEETDTPAETITPTASPAELFGEFEDEEDVPVGDAIATPRPLVETPPSDANLEAMLHQEIVGINAMDDDSNAIDSSFSVCDDTSAGELTEEPEECVEDLTTATDNEGEQDEEANPVLWISDDEPESCTTRTQMEGDDRDILVIEDEIELRRIDRAARVDSQDQTISVDFQEMLTRMRSSS